ncbi:BNR/Asp-box repeat domain protein [Talaromyces stipitatus ATCC 10500]|uniref:BNR/Asp-box repeat domain protein n=1 Tax=Talaromyces stipitatus (strain ATCC 10500 / CBS 375.48 / QM 6759 / NRRL 1006) TaxID=441959 RepID=B8MQN1_TALSN|nr:BNR/Asp-box repeat domain protein [Talaromyces stipitatus ATCC 10500]EED13454.1 BNR/Asp-box repeat domain protein [Talaromyces stipitatus ATCC 10500]
MGIGQKILRRLGVSSDSTPPPVPPHPNPPVWNTQSQASLIINPDERDISTDRFNGTYIRLARLANGTILAGFTWREGGRMDALRILKISRSLDGGQSFHDFSEVYRGHGEIDNLHICEISPDGHILAAFRNHDFGHNRAGDLAGITHFRITVFESKDAGATWHYLSEAAEKSDPPLGIWEPFIRMGVQGERTMQVTSYNRANLVPTTLHRGIPRQIRDGMTGITQTIDAATGQIALVMVFETTRYAPHFNVEAVVSYDDGYTWHHRHQVYTPRRRGHNAGAPQITSFGDGSLAAVFMTDDDSAEVKWIHNAAIKICFAGPPCNGRIVWSEPVEVSPASSFWPGIMALDQRTALVTYEHEGPRGRTVVRP